MHLTKAAGKELERLGLLPKQEQPKKERPPHWPYRSKWEQDYVVEELDPAKACGLVWNWHYEAVSFVLVPASEHQRGVRYVPDFIVIDPNGRMEIHEVKGHWMPGAKHKVKALAKMLAPTPVYVLRKVAGRWERERF
jgi:hypothetical protein